MRRDFSAVIFGGFIMLCTVVSFAQNIGSENQEIFGEFIDRSGNEYRSASGKPGPKYWQNYADYEIEVSLDTNKNMVSGTVVIDYLNNSPEELEFVWLQLEQNRFTETSRGTLTTPLRGDRYASDTDGGFLIENVEAGAGGQIIPQEYFITDTRMQIFLDEPVKAEGGRLKIRMDFSFKIPKDGMDRMGWMSTENGKIYAVAQWYPKMAVFDDVTGWNNLPYLGAGEFYLEYGNFDYKITVPYDHIVVGSGELINRSEVLSHTLQKRWEEAEKSEKPVFLIREDEVGDTELTRPQSSGTITWHFRMKNTRDVAFASSSAFVWDAARLNLSEGEAMVHSVYPVESAGEQGWGRSTEYTKAAVEFYDKTYYPFPYPTAVNVACNVAGMEYPGVSFCHYQSRGQALWNVTDHEFGHNWFPMIVGSNERKYVWLDEGLNMLLNHYSTMNFNGGEYPSVLSQSRRFVSWLTSDRREAVMTYPEVVGRNNLGMTGYYKPAIGLIVLREYILTPERFDRALRTYIERWAYKHPRPVDFFNTIENVTGEDLNWFWKGWFYENGNIDLGINQVRRQNDGYLISLMSKGEIPMPVHMEIRYEDGSTENLKLPVEIWYRGPEWNYFHRTEKNIVSVEIDPENILPDINSTNDVWPEGTGDR